LGEILLYLNNLHKSIANIYAVNLNEKRPRTLRLVHDVTVNDLLFNHIKRLGMEQKWSQGFCRYGEGGGKVEKGKTKIINPLRTDIGPS
jgi:hypothetical protein